MPLGPSYSGPIVSQTAVFTTETEKKEREVVRALDRKTGKELWRVEWNGSLTVPFFASANGSWIRATPAFDGERLYVAGIRDLLVCLDAATGKELWKVDFVDKFNAPLPPFGFVSSPLVDGEALYVQAGASIFRLDKKSGEVVWRSLKDDGGMMGSAFSSPILADIAGKHQLLVQTREKLCGLDPANGDVLWSRPIPSTRGMNILTPVVFGDGVFTSSYQHKSWLINVQSDGGGFRTDEAWSSPTPGYMSTPVVIDGHAYVHLQNQRFACLDLKTGEKKWVSKSFGKYASLVANGDKILALDQRGKLLLIKADPKEFKLLSERGLTDQETWAHLGACDDELFVRELTAMTVYRWKRPRN